MKSFEGKTALISGGSSGIGLSLARALGARGARVAVTGTNQEKLAQAAAVLGAAGVEAMTLRFDVTDEQAWRKAAQQVEERLGPIRFLALNAGIAGSGGPTETQTSEAWQASWNINVMGVLHGLQACLGAMKASGEAGHVVITSSIAAALRTPAMGAYGITKLAALALAENLRVELQGTALGVSVLIPGPIRTRFPETSVRHAGVDHNPAMTAQIMALLENAGLAPDQLGEFALDQIQKGAFYIFSHSGLREAILGRSAEFADASDIALAPMPALP